MICSITGCEKGVQSRGWCPMHYQRWRAHGDPLNGARKPRGKACAITGCEKTAIARGWCGMHWARWSRYGDVGIVLNRPRGAGSITRGYVVRQEDGVSLYEHVRIAERALGRPLRGRELVHHADRNPSNNTNSNLVVCPSMAYHMMLHVRTRAIRACGDAHGKKCSFCKQWSVGDDNIMTLVVGKGERSYHRACAARYQRERHQEMPNAEG